MWTSEWSQWGRGPQAMGPVEFSPNPGSSYKVGRGIRKQTRSPGLPQLSVGLEGIAAL